MKRLLKTICLLLSILCVLPLLFSCSGGKKGEVAQTTADAQTTNEPDATTPDLKFDIQFLPQPILLCDADESPYRLIRPDGVDEEVEELAMEVAKYAILQGHPEMNLSFGDDERVKASTQSKELLVGFTNRPESLEVLEDIGYDDYAIVTVNNKIVVAAHTLPRLREAADFLCRYLLQVKTDAEGRTGLYYLGDYHFKSEKQSFVFNAENPMKEYSIVYNESSSHSTTSAQVLQQEIQRVYGVQLPLVKDSTTPAEKEILVGAVNRDLAKEAMKAGEGEEVGSIIATKGKQIFIGSSNDKMTRVVVYGFCQRYLAPGYSYGFNLQSEAVIKDDACQYKDTIELAEGADLRIMSFNILCELWNSDAVIEGREGYVTAPVFAYEPDILGMQEVSEKWYPPLLELFGTQYAFVDTTFNTNVTNYSPLIYNTETLTLLEHGVKKLTVSNNYKLRVLSWGYFERKSDGARFVAVNTHWNLSTDPSGRSAQAIEMGNFVKELMEKYDCPAITTGDYNTKVSNEQHAQLCQQGGLSDTLLVAKTANRICKTNRKLFQHPVVEVGEAIDHIFVSSEIEVLFYNVLVDEILDNASDHCPIYADVKLPVKKS